VLLHEAIGHPLEGDFNRKGTSRFSGRSASASPRPGVTVVDDGAIDSRRGSLTIDDEGTPTQRNVLIEDGILKGYIHDRLNARLMGVAPTGNGRRESFAHAPMPRMTNTFMLGGRTIRARSSPARRTASTPRASAAGRWTSRAASSSSLHRGLPDREWPPRRADQGRDPDRRRPSVLTKVAAIGNDMALDEGVGRVRQGRAVGAGGVGQPTLAGRGADGRGTGGVRLSQNNARPELVEGHPFFLCA
jgi:TldD protein